MVTYAFLIYLAIFGLSLGYKTYIINPTQHLLQGNTITSSQRASLNSTIVTIGSTEANSPGDNQNTILILTIEIIALTVCAFLEMKYHIIAKILKIWWLRDLLSVIPFAILFAICIYSFGWEIGIAIGIVGLVVFSGVYFIIAKLAKKFILSAIIVLLSYMILYLLIAPSLNLFSLSNNAKTAINVIYVVGLLAVALISIRLISTSKNNKNILNLTMIISVISFAIYFGLLISIWWLVALIIIFSVYDVIAVLKLGTMQFLATKLYKENIPGMLIMGDKDQLDKKIDNLSKPKDKDIIQTPPKKRINASILGSGDLAIPGAVIASAVYYLPNIAPFLVVGATVGMIANALWLYSNVSSTRRGIPALPFIAAGICIALIIGLII